MICTDTDHYVNTLSTIKKDKKKINLRSSRLFLREDTAAEVLSCDLCKIFKDIYFQGRRSRCDW